MTVYSCKLFVHGNKVFGCLFAFPTSYKFDGSTLCLVHRQWAHTKYPTGLVLYKYRGEAIVKYTSSHINNEDCWITFSHICVSLFIIYCSR